MNYALFYQVNGKSIAYPLHAGRNTLGSQQKTCDVIVNIDGVSRSHAAIDLDADRVRIVDLHSKNGTYVNGARVQEQTLHIGDAIVLGPLEFRFDAEMVSLPVTLNNSSKLNEADLSWSQAITSLDKTPRQGNGRSRLFNALLELGAFLVTDEVSADIYRACLKQVARMFRFRRACLVVLNDGGAPEVRSCYPADCTADELSVSRTMIDTVVREHRPLLVRDAGLQSLTDSVVFNGIRSALVVPLFHGNEVLGALYMDHEMGHAYEERHLERLQLMGNLVAAKLAQAVTQKAMRGAAYIQSSMLCRVPVQPPGLQVAFHLEPSAEVGGDLYETLALPDGRYLYALGDVSGHHLDAALVMSNVMATMRALTPRAQSPLQLVEDIQELITGRLPQNGYLTLFLGFFDPKTQQFDYVNAGHDPPILFLPDVDGAPAVELSSTGPPIGMQLPLPLEASRVQLPKGALLCAWSDGIFEAARPGMQPEQFSRERLVQLLTKVREEPVHEIVASVFSELKAFLGDTHIRDDCTMLVLRRS